MRFEIFIHIIDMFGLGEVGRNHLFNDRCRAFNRDRYFIFPTRLIRNEGNVRPPCHYILQRLAEPESCLNEDSESHARLIEETFRVGIYSLLLALVLVEWYTGNKGEYLKSSARVNILLDTLHEILQENLTNQLISESQQKPLRHILAQRSARLTSPEIGKIEIDAVPQNEADQSPRTILSESERRHEIHGKYRERIFLYRGLGRHDHEIYLGGLVLSQAMVREQL